MALADRLPDWIGPQPEADSKPTRHRRQRRSYSPHRACSNVGPSHTAAGTAWTRGTGRTSTPPTRPPEDLHPPRHLAQRRRPTPPQPRSLPRDHRRPAPGEPAPAASHPASTDVHLRRGGEPRPRLTGITGSHPRSLAAPAPQTADRQPPPQHSHRPRRLHPRSDLPRRDRPRSNRAQPTTSHRAGMTGKNRLQHPDGPTSMTSQRSLSCHPKRPAQVSEPMPRTIHCHRTKWNPQIASEVSERVRAPSSTPLRRNAMKARHHPHGSSVG